MYRDRTIRHKEVIRRLDLSDGIGLPPDKVMSVTNILINLREDNNKLSLKLKEIEEKLDEANRKLNALSK